MWQSSQHGSGLLGYDEGFSWIGYHFLAVISGDLHFFFHLQPNNRKEALVYFCLMLKLAQPLEMTNRLIRLVWPAAEPARLTVRSTPLMAARLFSCGESKHDQTTVGKCVWCLHFKAVLLNIIG